MYGCGKDCLILIPFRLPEISCFTLSLICFFFDANSCFHVGIRPLLQFPHPPRVGPVLETLLFFPLVPTKVCVVLYIRFHWSGTVICSKLVFCRHFCVWRCIPDISMERGVLHIHLLLLHLALSHFLILKGSNNIHFPRLFQGLMKVFMNLLYLAHSGEWMVPVLFDQGTWEHLTPVFNGL